ncbi:TetR family transcriptional regulator BioQ [soil metagenome]
MRYRRADIVEHAIAVLDQYGLGDLTMRRLATELGLQPSAFYHHFANKQSLLAAVGDEILLRGLRDDDATLPWDQQTVAHCNALRDSMLAYRDGAELIATVHSFGLGDHRPYARLVSLIESGGYDEVFARAAAATLLHFIFGHVSDEQTQLQANSVGAIDTEPASSGTDTYELGLSLILDGIRLRLPAPR